MNFGQDIQMKKMLSFFLNIAILCACGIAFFGCNEAQAACTHSYVKTSCTAGCYVGGTAVYACSLCGDTYTKYESPLEHDYTEATCTKGKECARCGYVSGEALGHAEKDGVCSRCSEKIE